MCVCVCVSERERETEREREREGGRGKAYSCRNVHRYIIIADKEGTSEGVSCSLHINYINIVVQQNKQ